MFTLVHVMYKANHYDLALLPLAPSSFFNGAWLENPGLAFGTSGAIKRKGCSCFLWAKVSRCYWGEEQPGICSQHLTKVSHSRNVFFTPSGKQTTKSGNPPKQPPLPPTPWRLTGSQDQFFVKLVCHDRFREVPEKRRSNSAKVTNNQGPFHSGKDSAGGGGALYLNLLHRDCSSGSLYALIPYDA